MEKVVQRMETGMEMAVGGRGEKQSYAESSKIDGRCDGLPWVALKR